MSWVAEPSQIRITWHMRWTGEGEDEGRVRKPETPIVFAELSELKSAELRRWIELEVKECAESMSPELT